MSEGNTARTVFAGGPALPFLQNRAAAERATRARDARRLEAVQALEHRGGAQVHRLAAGERARRGLCPEGRHGDGVQANRGRAEDAAEADPPHPDRGCRRRCEAQARPSPEAADLDRPAERLERRGAQRSRLPFDSRAELGAGGPAGEVRAQQDALERRQLAVELGRRPLARAVTVSVHRSHSSFDGGGGEKLDPSNEGDVPQTGECCVSISTPITTRITPSTMKTAELLIVSSCSSNVAQR